jgi:hypothetical protein
MNMKERTFIAIVLAMIVVLVGVDLITDSHEGVKWGHLLVEAFTAIAALAGSFIMIRGSFVLRHELSEERRVSSINKLETDEF